jgi:hypothetical protein
MDSTYSGLSPTNLPLNSDAKHKSQVVVFISEGSVKHQSSHTLLLGFNHLLGWLLELKSVLTYVNQVII